MKTRILLTLVLCTSVSLDTLAARRRRPKPKPAPVILVPTRIEIEEGTTPAARVYVAVGQTTAIFTPSPMRQLVSSIVGGFAKEGCDAPVCRQEGNQATPGNVVYLSATTPGKKANLWIETADGTLMVHLTTVGGDSPFTHEARIRTKATEAALKGLRDDLVYCKNDLGATRRRLGEAETAATEAARLAKEARREGFTEGASAARAEALTAFQTFEVKAPKKSRRTKTRDLIVTETARAVRTPAGWWTFYRVENRLHNAVEIEAVTETGVAELSGGDRSVPARSKRQFAVFVAADKEQPQPAVALQPRSSERSIAHVGQ